MAWRAPAPAATPTTVRITRAGAAGASTTGFLETVQYAATPIVAANANTEPLVAFGSTQRAYEKNERGAVLLLSELTGTSVSPSTPLIIDAAVDGDFLVVDWHPVPGAFGIEIEAQLANGRFRLIGTAAGMRRPRACRSWA